MTNNADVLLIACSELSVISAGITVPFVDSLDVLAQAVVTFATSGVGKQAGVGKQDLRR